MRIALVSCCAMIDRACHGALSSRGWLARPECASRSSDALHLAVAFGYGYKQFITFGQPLAAAARKLGLPAAVLEA